ncbi:hypothetical protein [Marinobacterium rhizophilum]|uniref:hypothetical protein n=1 Tax=Marinobacterium rhizophilum TaxID=420402 RepID=UPI0012EB4A03|nr:hypothetical protein [Marinobacterium rhizophilum]
MENFKYLFILFLIFFVIDAVGNIVKGYFRSVGAGRQKRPSPNEKIFRRVDSVEKSLDQRLLQLEQRVSRLEQWMGLRSK